MLQATRPDSVRARLVFVNLLKCNSQGVAKLSLIHIEHQAAHADSAADVFINWIRGFDSGHRSVSRLCMYYGKIGAPSRWVLESPLFLSAEFIERFECISDLLAFNGIRVNLG